MKALLASVALLAGLAGCASSPTTADVGQRLRSMTERMQADRDRSVSCTTTALGQGVARTTCN